MDHYTFGYYKNNNLEEIFAFHEGDDFFDIKEIGSIYNVISYLDNLNIGKGQVTFLGFKANQIAKIIYHVIKNKDIVETYTYNSFVLRDKKRFVRGLIK